MLNSRSQPSGWGSEELNGEEKAVEDAKSEAGASSCFHRLADLLH